MGCGVSMDMNTIDEDPKPITNGLIRWQQQSGTNSMSIVQEFVRLDQKIGDLEADCPGPRMATQEAWIEHLQVKLNTLLGVEGAGIEAGGYHALQQLHQQQQQQATISGSAHMNGELLHLTSYNNAASHANTNRNVFVVHSPPPPPPPHQQQQQQSNGILPTQIKGPTTTSTTTIATATVTAINDAGVERHSNHIVSNTPNQDLANLALNLGVVGDAQKASIHEDFFANLSESALHLMTVRDYTEILEHTKVRLKKLVDAYADLNELYVEHDGIIAFISGGTYMSRLEESLDAQLETARDVRDKLGSTMEQWRICGMLLRASANAATQALQQWRRLSHSIKPNEKIQIALECRNSLQASLISLDCAQLSLPHVELKHVSNRQVLAVQHCNTYMITDISNLARYEHTTKVFTVYESNMSKASVWLYETFKKTLRLDFEKAEEGVRNLAKTLRDHREEIFTAARK